jgi:DNA primase
MAAAPPLPSQAAQVKQELIVTRLAARLGLRQETLWARLRELRHERRQKELQAIPKVNAPAPAATPGGGPQTPAKADPRLAAEQQLLELLLAHPGFVPQASAAITPDEITHTGIRRIVGELYALHAEGLVADLDALRERLSDRADLFEAAQKRYFIGQHMQEPAAWLARLLKWFTDARIRAEQRAVKEQLAAAGEEQAVELLRRLQETGRKNAG